MRNAVADAPATRFLGVRLTAEEASLLDRIRTAREFPSRSEAIRALVREAVAERAESVDLPVTLRSELEELVQEGYAKDVDSALALVVHLGIAELARIHADRWNALRDHARATSERRTGRRRADREGRGLLGR